MHKAHHQHTFLGSDRAAARYVAQPLTRFLSIEAAGGALLVVAAAIALVWANSPWSSSYVSFFNTEIVLDVGSFQLEGTVQHWINDGLMAIFFFVAGLEIKRELVRGELRDPRAAALPIIGALGGMLVPALIYFALNAGTDASRGFGVPVATDIAFAVGVVSLLGRSVPSGLKLFLLALAIADDLGGIIVIAVFYASGISLPWLALAAAGLGLVYVMQRWKVRYLPVYVAIGVGVWLAMYESGVHATIAGVALGLLTPTFPLRDDVDAEAIADTLENRDDLTAADVRSASFLIQETVPIGDRLAETLHPWAAYVILPIFALANAGIPLGRDALSTALSSRITYGVFLGLVVGKTVGVFCAAKASSKLGWTTLPDGSTNLHLLATAMAAGIGFTVAIFVTGLAFGGNAAFEDQAKVGIIAASLVAAGLSAVTFNVADRRPRRSSPALDDTLVAGRSAAPIEV